MSARQRIGLFRLLLTQSLVDLLNAAFDLRIVFNTVVTRLWQFGQTAATLLG